MNESTTYLDLLVPGEGGDSEVTLRLSARQVAAIQLVISVGVKVGAGVVAHQAAQQHDVGDSFRIAFTEAEARIGLALAQVIDAGDYKAEFSAVLAQLEQEKASLKEGGD